MDSEGFASLGWLFRIWADGLLSLIVATEPLFAAMTSGASVLVPAASFAWLTLLMVRLADVGFVRGFFGGALILAVVILGTRPTAFTSEGRASVQLNQMQSVALHLVIDVQGVFSDRIGAALTANSIEGTILPVEAATRDAVERNARNFQGSDLARLIRDYNAQCGPETAELTSPQHAARRDAYYAVGLLGGGGLGIPAERFSVLTRLRTKAASGFWAMSGPVWSLLGLSYASDSADLSAIAARRAEGIAALEAAEKGFAATGAYSLPTRDSWRGAYSGDKGSKSDYLRAGDAPGTLSLALQKNASAWREDEGAGAVIGLMPTNCVEAYQLAQWGAEQAYLALEETGKKPVEGQASSADSGTVGAALAWQRTLQRTVNGGETGGGVATEAASGFLSGLQMAKNVWAWLDLNTLLPAYVGGMAVLTWLVLLAAPIALLLAVIRGFQVLLSWCSLIAFPVCCVVIAQLLSVGISFAMAGISSQQAAVASGWLGGSADLDVLRGLLGMAAAVFLAATTWLSSQWTGVSLGGLSGSAGGAVATVTTAANVAASVAGFASMVSRQLDSRASSGKNPSGGRGGGGDGQPRSSPPSRPGPGSDVQQTIRSMQASTQQGTQRSSSLGARNWAGMKQREAETKKPELVPSKPKE